MKKFSDKRALTTSKERIWAEKRDALLEKISGRMVSESPFVYMDRRLVSQTIAKIKIFEVIREVQGSVIECGVHRGNGLMLFNHLSSTFSPVGFNRKIIGFDTFTGFTGVSHNDSSGINEGDMGDVSLDQLVEWIELQQENNLISHIDRVELVVGDARETIKRYFVENPHTIVALLYMDFDLYEPTRAALETIVPNMPKGSVIAFDQLNQKKWYGETAAVKEFFDIRRLKLNSFEFEPHISYVILE
jgi:hypothetical protein